MQIYAMFRKVSNLDPAKVCFTSNVKPRYSFSERLCLTAKLVFNKIYFPQRHADW